jgi:hypothetical protein
MRANIGKDDLANFALMEAETIQAFSFRSSLSPVASRPSLLDFARSDMLSVTARSGIFRVTARTDRV